MMARMTASQTVALAESFKGLSESPPYSNRVLFTQWYGFVGPWCAMFVSYIMSHAGVNIPKFAYCPDGVEWAQKNGKWFTDRSHARPGDLIFYSFEGRRADHVGIVKGRLADGRMDTIEGNTGSNNRDGGSVQERYRNTGIIGFARIDYPAASAPVSQWPTLGRVLKYGAAPGDDIAIWKIYMLALGLAPEFKGMDITKLRTFGRTTSPNVAYRFKVLYNAIFKLSPGERGHLTENHQIDGHDWQGVIWCMATRK